MKSHKLLIPIPYEEYKSLLSIKSELESKDSILTSLTNNRDIQIYDPKELHKELSLRVNELQSANSSWAIQCRQLTQSLEELNKMSTFRFITRKIQKWVKK